MRYDEALSLLATLGPELSTGNALVPGTAPRKFSLEYIRVLLAELGSPQTSFPSILIAGTNGKGSTAATLASISRAAGLRTGLYTSPHLLAVNERMRINGDAISDRDFGRLFGEVYATGQSLVSRGQLPHTPSFFELLTATGFLYFAAEHVQMAVLEVGLGGRLDATNVVEPLVSVITDIGMDHTEFLGNTITSIAREKAGILRQNGVLVTLSQHPEANAAIGEMAVALNVRGVDAARCLPPRGFTGQATPSLHAVPFLRSSSLSLSASGTETLTPFIRNELEGPAPVAHAAEQRSVFAPATQTTGAAPIASLLGQNRYPLSLEGQIVQIDSPLAGQHQQRNLALAVATALELRANHGFAIPNSAIEAGVRATVWPGRLEWVELREGKAPLLLDVAHNPAGAWTLRAALAQLPEDRPRTLIFSCLADKQVDEIARILLPLFDATSGDPERRRDHIIFAPLANPRAATIEQLLKAAHTLDVPAHAAPHLQAALLQAETLTPEEGFIVATGSVYLVGELRALALARYPPSKSQ